MAHYFRYGLSSISSPKDRVAADKINQNKKSRAIVLLLL